MNVEERALRILATLQDITHGCRDDMHEPDEQELRVRVVGDHLDNAMGNHVDLNHVMYGSQEFVVCFERVRDGKFERANINLADIIALARRADVR